MTSSIFTGLSTFPITPLHDDKVDEEAFASLITRLVVANVDSITVLGSTGSYAYLTPSECARMQSSPSNMRDRRPCSSVSEIYAPRTSSPTSKPRSEQERRGCC